MTEENSKFIQQLYSALAKLAQSAESQLCKEESPRNTWQRFVAHPLTGKVGILLLTVWLGWLAQHTYKTAQLQNQKIQILESFLPHLSPELKASKNAPNDEQPNDDQIRMDQYYRQRQESERRYAALVALAEYENDELLLRMAVQYPKEGLSVATAIWDKDRPRIDRLVRKVLQRIIEKETSSMFVLNAQVQNLSLMLEAQSWQEELYGELSKVLASTDGISINLNDEIYDDVRGPLLRYAAALVVAKAVNSSINAPLSQKNRDLNKQQDRLKGFISAAPFIVAALAAPKDYEYILEPLNSNAIRRIVSNPPDDKSILFSVQNVRMKQNVLGFSKKLLESTKKLLVDEIDEIDGEPGEREFLQQLLESTVAETPANSNSDAARDLDDDSFRILAKLFSVSGLFILTELDDKFLSLCLRFLEDELHRIVEITKRHRGWISDEVEFLHSLAKKRLKELTDLIDSKDLTEDRLRDIVVRIAGFYGGLVWYGRGIEERWNTLYSNFECFMKFAKREDLCTKDLCELNLRISKLVASADLIPGTESRRLTEVCVALYRFRVMMINSRPEEATAPNIWMIGILSFVVMIAIAIGAISLVVKKRSAKAHAD